MLTPAALADLFDACRRHPAAAPQPMAVSVVDDQGEVSRQWRDPALPSIFAALSAAKASTSVKFPMPRAELQQWQLDKPLLHMQLSTLDRWPVVAADGSGRLEVDGTVVGALGVATSDGAVDQQICDDVLTELGYGRGPGTDQPATAPGRSSVPPDTGRDDSVAVLDPADAVLGWVLDRAAQLGLAVSVAVVDPGGALLSSGRTHASARTLELAEAKAYSSVVMGRPTSDLESWQRANPVLAMQLSTLGPHPIIADFGGYPIRSVDGRVMGGLGISGARGEDDQSLCVDALRELGYLVEPF